MKLYFAGGESTINYQNILLGGGRNMLMSVLSTLPKNKQGWIDDNWDDLSQFECIFLDSGAFSAFTLGIDIDINNYIAYLKKYQNKLTVYATLDVIGCEKGSAENQDYMIDQGVSPLPIFHSTQSKKDSSENFTIFEEQCDRYDYIGLGGGAGTTASFEETCRFFDRCFKIIGRHWKNGKKIKIHGLGVTSQKMLERYPFYSVDSTSWLAGQQYGSLYRWENKKLQQSSYREKSVMKFINYGLIDPIKENYAYKERVQNNVREFVKMGDFITDLWAKRGIVWDD